MREALALWKNRAVGGKSGSNSRKEGYPAGQEEIPGTLPILRAVAGRMGKFYLREVGYCLLLWRPKR